MPVAGREAHIHLCLVSVVRSSTSGPLVASDTDSSPAPSPQPSSLQFVAVGIRRPRRQSYVVFHSVKEIFSFHSLWKERESNPRCPTLLCRLSAAYPIPRLAPGLPSTTRPSFPLLCSLRFFRKGYPLSALRICNPRNSPSASIRCIFILG